MMEVVCCGRPVRAPFCWMCGRRLQEFPIGDLLIHCRAEAQKYEQRLVTEAVKQESATTWPRTDFGPLVNRLLAEAFPAVSRIPQEDQSPHDVETTRERVAWNNNVASAVRWRTWAAALEQLIQIASDIPAPPDPSTVRTLEIG